MSVVTRVTIVLATYCPHCVPFSLQNATRMAADFGVPLRVLDIEVPEQEEAADRLVEAHGDWAEDYLIPQIFVEYADGRVDHVLTGFSEAVSATAAAWDALFTSDYYQTRRQARALTERSPLQEFVETYLRFEGICRRHCDAPTAFVSLSSEENHLVGAYVCPTGYVSRVIYFSESPDLPWFRRFLTSQVGEEIVSDRDLRPATRHGWELGKDAAAAIGAVSPHQRLREVYWTIYPRTETAKSRGVFLCSDTEGRRGCRTLFVQDLTATTTLCPRCR